MITASGTEDPSNTFEDLLDSPGLDLNEGVVGIPEND